MLLEGPGLVYHLYILRNIPKGTLYVGVTKDVRRRLREHNAGASRGTRGGRPYELVHLESYQSLSQARRREWYLKRSPSGGREKRRLGHRSLGPPAADRNGGPGFARS
jgi:putative endonuclease